MATTTTAQDNKFRIRQAGPQDIDAVTDVMILSMQEDHGWWDYRFPHRHAYPEDHRKLLRLLVEAWISPDFDDWVVMVAEVHDTPSSSEGYQIACYSAWDVSYLNYRKHGPDYAPQDPGDVLARAGAAGHRDAEPSHTGEYARACDEGHARFLDARFGPEEQMHLQALGTHPLFLRRGLARAMCGWGMRRAAGDGVAVTLLASPMGRRVYPRFGFEELGMVRARVDGEEEGTELYAMAWVAGGGGGASEWLGE